MIPNVFIVETIKNHLKVNSVTFQPTQSYIHCRRGGNAKSERIGLKLSGNPLNMFYSQSAAV